MGVAWRVAEERQGGRKAECFTSLCLVPGGRERRGHRRWEGHWGIVSQGEGKPRSEDDWVWRRQRGDEGVQLAYLLPGMSGSVGFQGIATFIFRT